MDHSVSSCVPEQLIFGSRLSLWLIINHYSWCGFGRDSLFWCMWHLTPQFTPQSTPWFGSFHLDLSSLSDSRINAEGLCNVNTHTRTNFFAWKARWTHFKLTGLVCATALLTLKECIHSIPNLLSCRMPCNAFLAKIKTFFLMYQWRQTACLAPLRPSFGYFLKHSKLNPVTLTADQRSAWAELDTLNVNASFAA